jgi:hypothetical protein
MRHETFEQLIARVNAGGYLPPVGVSTMRELKMAKGKEYTFKTAKAAQSKYPWDEWFNGKLNLIERSVGPENDKGTIEEPTEAKDYGVPTDAMPPKIKVAARRRYKVCQIGRTDADGSRLVDALIIRARDMNAEERAAEDLLRAEEKAKRQAANEDGDDEQSTSESNEENAA